MRRPVTRTPTRAVLLAHSYLWLLRLLLDGEPRRRAFHRSAKLYFHVLMPATNRTEGNLVNIQPQPGPDPQVLTSRCLARTAQLLTEALQLPWDQWHALEPLDPGTLLDPDDHATLVWLAETIRRIAEGQPHLDAARAAHDQHLRKPRQRRQPADPGWLASIVDHMLQATWTALRHVRIPEPILFLPAGPERPFLPPSWTTPIHPPDP